MKYLVVVPDGAADQHVKELGCRTPLEVANKPTIDRLAADSLIGTVSNVPYDMVPESDTANLAILSYDPRRYSKGRSPLEAMSMGLEMKELDVAFRCNVITLSEEENPDDRVILDHSADEITTEEAAELIKTVEEKFGRSDRHFYPGISYRHCMIWNNPPEYGNFERPHDHIGDKTGGLYPAGEYGDLVRASYDILKDHPINIARKKRGLKPANSIWLWSPGGMPNLPSFKKKWGMNGVVISAVDLIKGIGICAGMKSIDVEGATGNWKTNYEGKAKAACDAFRSGADFVYVHIEAPDECGHRAEALNKVKSIEDISEKIVKPCVEYLEGTGEPFTLILLPDHPTPINVRTHTIDPVPFMVYRSDKKENGISCFAEKPAKQKYFYIAGGWNLLDIVINGQKVARTPIGKESEDTYKEEIPAGAPKAKRKPKDVKPTKKEKEAEELAKRISMENKAGKAGRNRVTGKLGEEGKTKRYAKLNKK